MNRDSSLQAFYAYSSKPEFVSDQVSETIRLLNDMKGNVRVTDWLSLNVAGKYVIDTICREIDRSDIIICDLTTHNHNVLFELGYAIAKDKPLTLITLNATHQDAERRYRELRLLTTIGYTNYESPHELLNKLLTELNSEDRLSTILDAHQGNLALPRYSHSNSVFYLKSRKRTPESTALEATLLKGDMTIVQDDPQQGTGQSLAWYIENTVQSEAVLVHLSSGGSDNAGHDAKYALAAGLAHGFEKHLLIVAHAPYVTPIDYRDLTHEHESASDCVRAYNRWIGPIDKPKPTVEQGKLETFSKIQDIRRVDVGQYLAENEEDSLAKYFVETAAYREALDSTNYLLFVGRKGTGKTANLVMLSAEMRSRRDSHVCIIRPVKSEFEQIFRLFSLSKSKASMGYLLEAMWKFLVTTELAISVCSEINSRPLHVVRRSKESKLIQFVEENANSIGAGFSDRLEYALRELCEMKSFEGAPDERARVSEILHTHIIGRLREYLGEILSEKTNVAILIDNLDQGWEHRDDLQEMSSFLFGLLRVARAIADDFRRETLKLREVRMSMIVFLRSDIFYFIRKNAGEADKLDFSQTQWNDRELLWRVVERRFAHSLGVNEGPGHIWQEYFADMVNGVPVDEYIIRRIIPRPRDIIFLCRAALVKARNRKHSKIEERDILDAEIEYSSFTVDVLLAEIDKDYPNITRSLLFEFIGENEILTKNEIEKRLSVGGISDTKLDSVINVLVDNSFLAVETSEDEFTFIYEDDERDRTLIKARKLQERTSTTRYCIHPAFHPVLEVSGQRIFRNGVSPT